MHKLHYNGKLTQIFAWLSSTSSSTSTLMTAR